MFIYTQGSDAVRLLTEEVPNIHCPKCKSDTTMLLHVYRKHRHVLGLPLFPIGKMGIFECGNCKATFEYSSTMFEKKEMTKEMLEEYNQIKASAKGKWWQWLGVYLVLFAIFILPSIFAVIVELNK